MLNMIIVLEKEKEYTCEPNAYDCLIFYQKMSTLALKYIPLVAIKSNEFISDHRFNKLSLLIKQYRL